MHKLKQSKYKNVAAKVAKREDSYLGITPGQSKSLRTIVASNSHIVYCSNNGLSYINLSTKGLLSSDQIFAIPSGNICDVEVCPCDDDLLATLGEDSTVCLWRLPTSAADIAASELSFASAQQLATCLRWHPLASSLLAVGADKSVIIVDAVTSSPSLSLPLADDQIQSVGWKASGDHLVVSSKDKKLRVLDPRTASAVQVTSGHQNNRDSQVTWLGSSHFFISSGFNQTRQREVLLFDSRRLATPVKTASFDSSSSVLLPWYDADTNLLYLAGKGDTCVRVLELLETDGVLSDVCVDTVEQMQGFCLLPKRAVDVMQCEVNRGLVLTKQSIVPVMYQVPRKSYRDFQEDLFPDTFSGQPSLTSSEWLGGENKQASLVSLNPSKRSAGSGKVKETKPGTPAAEHTPTQQAQSVSASAPRDVADHTPPVHQNSTPAKPKPLISDPRRGKYKNVKGTIAHKSQHIDNIPTVSQSVPRESNGFSVNRTHCAVVLNSPSGLVAVLALSEKGRLPSTGVTTLENKSAVTDLAWDPFNDHRLAVACDSGRILLWTIPDENFSGLQTEPASTVSCQVGKATCLAFHPLASDVLAASHSDFSVRVWNLASGDCCFALDGHTDTVFGVSWNASGSQLATVCKDRKIRVYEPRQQTQPLAEGAGPDGVGGARVCWACDGQLLVTAGFDKSKRRLLTVYNASDVSLLQTVEMDTTPSVLTLFYDADSATLFVTGKGERTVMAFEVSTVSPHFSQLSDFKADTPHLAVAFQPKVVCDVKAVEFARAVRLTSASIEPVTFAVPRVKSQHYFQDDLFPDTLVTWQATMTADEWLVSSDKTPARLSLAPAGMPTLSELESTSGRAAGRHDTGTVHAQQNEFKSDAQKKTELVTGIMAQLDFHTRTNQSDDNGVDESEWD